jgi:L-threonylcarbamoyladenylate synthase
MSGVETRRVDAAGLVEAVEAAVDCLSAGEVVALPTETVYGLAADATRPEAVLKIFEAKARPLFDPLIVHLPGMEWLERVCALEQGLRRQVEALAAAFWPGPLTLVLPRKPMVPDLVTSGLETVAVRISAHPVFDAVVRKFGRPLAAPSANRFGRISPTAAGHVLEELGGRIPLVIDGGPCRHGIESTIVAPAGDELRVLRAGPVAPSDLERFGTVRMISGVKEVRPEAPGQLASHYAPRTPMRLRVGDEWPEGAGVLFWRGQPEPRGRCEVLSPAGDLREAAMNLFAKLRQLDESGVTEILAEPVPETGVGIAIMDRIRRAAHRGV